MCLKIVYPYTHWLMIIIPIKWLFHWEYTLFSDKPVCFDDVKCSQHQQQSHLSAQFDSMTVPQLKEKAKEALSQWLSLETVGDSWRYVEISAPWLWCSYCSCWASPCCCNYNCRDSLFAINIHCPFILNATRWNSPIVWDMSFKPHSTPVQTDLRKIYSRETHMYL